MTLTNPYEVDSNTLGDEWLLECSTDSKELALLSGPCSPDFFPILRNSVLHVNIDQPSRHPCPLRASSLRGVPKALDPIHRETG